MKLRVRGFTLVEIMIVVTIIGIIAAIAIPNFVVTRKTAERNVCSASKGQIEQALEWACFEDLSLDYTNLTQSEIEDIIVPVYLNKMPLCPSGGLYHTNESGQVGCDPHDEDIVVSPQGPPPPVP